MLIEVVERDDPLFKTALSLVTPEILGSIIDLSELRPTATHEDIRTLCETADSIGSSVCVHGSRVAFSRNLKEARLPNIRHIAAVIDFPFGAGTLETKVASAESVLEHGADEIDTVLNVGMFLERREGFIKEEITAVALVVRQKELSSGTPKALKVIQENCYLREYDGVRGGGVRIASHIIGEVAQETGAHIFMKTSTGFGSPQTPGTPIGATLSDVWNMALMADAFQRRGARVGVKASSLSKDGSIAETAVKMMLAGGCFDVGVRLRENLPDIFRIGTSSKKIVEDYKKLRNELLGIL